MKPLNKVIVEFLKNPIANYRKIWPYTKAHLLIFARKLFEFLHIDFLSKPYDGHTDLLKELNIDNGFFVECGGNDGYSFDPTYYLEKFKGWSGIIIEPLPRMAKACEKNRPASTIFEVALVSKEHKGSEIELFDCNLMSVTASTEYDINEWISKGEEAQKIKATKIKVPALTLDAVLEKAKIDSDIDLLVIDTEGSEAEILEGLSLDKYKPKYIMVEMATDGLKNRVESILRDKYTFIKKISYSDHLYKLKG